ncbi:MAG: phosphoglycerate kinase [Bacteroidia bacterium]|nr:phosphoglycerate kinase [Bacteroidota bacterium]MBK7390414.1 phosphoglycerate kinase [Bacteroidota bacterium]MBK8873611.1 phosphoglycerate kinase [Bacteroidota bacterium]MBP9081535.1 phosphoglycerate kinase [Bacteroidia bacterium]
MKTIDQYNFSGKRALIRVDFNVPLDKATLAVTDDTRIRAAIDTIRKILADGGSVILMSHLGRPKEGPADKYSLRNVVKTLSELLNKEIKFADDCIGEQAKTLAKNLQPGEVLLLENLRFYKEEEKGDEAFAQKLASLGDVYVNDAFGTAHRRHASTAVIAQYFPGNKLFGYVMANELTNANRVLSSAQKPFTAITGGAKVSDKILIIEQLLNKVDHLIIGGGMSYTFFRAMGGQTGSSLCEEDKLDLAREILDKATAKGVKIHLPVDSIIADAFSNEANHKTCASGEIPDGWMGLDIGPVAAMQFAEVISHSKTILWNGPMGVFEMSNFERGTRMVADAIVHATSMGAFSLIGGGDSAAAINKFELGKKVSYVSTGGGALLEYIEGKVLPGVEMLLAD